MQIMCRHTFFLREKKRRKGEGKKYKHSNSGYVFLPWDLLLVCKLKKKLLRNAYSIQNLLLALEVLFSHIY